MSLHEDWVRQIDAELDGELTLAERAALARHLAGCPACAGARASHLELRVALARSAGEPHARAGAGPARARWRRRVPRSWSSKVVAAALLGATPALGQAPGFRLTYGVRVLERVSGEVRPVATGAISGPQDTDMRLALRTDTTEVEALLDVFPEPD